tara:strand:- start:4143 stop:6170 length:2028 start_codon:yes stop_codon:yes gene_type:complete
MADQYFHFTLGPVQAFVAQARRTRDFWAGSFLLSWLSSVAMQEVKQQGGEIKFPLPDDGYLSYLTGTNTDPDKAPRQGSIPNRFKAMQAKVPASFNPQQVTDAVQTVWSELAQLIWQGDLSDSSPETRAVWQRQVDNFWDISWVLTDEENATDLLDRRKNWRTYMAPTEPGVSCMMMNGWQELSAEERPGKQLHTFWKTLRKHGKKGIKTDLRPAESLCAIAWIKRRFVRYFEQLDVNIHGWTLKGWKLPVNVPSVNYLAAAPWLANSIHDAGNDSALQMKIRHFAASVNLLDGSREGTSVNLTRIKQASAQSGLQDWQWQQVNGRYLYEDELRLIADRSDDVEEREMATNCVRQLRDIQSTAGRPSDFYAILLMDGDSLGSQMGDKDKQSRISTALNDFTRQVPDIVNQHSGFLVYAGGDDVLALLSVDDSLACGEALKTLYDRCFAEQNAASTKPIETSLSGALMYCHYKSPLARNLAKAHPLLDDIAKDQCGRNSLAVQVWKPGGLHCSWSTPWQTLEDRSRVQGLNSLVADLIAEKKKEGRFARKFFFKLEELVNTLGLDCTTKAEAEAGKIENQSDLLQPGNIKSLFRAAWAHTGKNINELPPQLPDQLLALTEVWVRKTPSDSHDRNETTQPVNQNRFSTDALKLLHFLTTELQSAPAPIDAKEHKEAL